MLLLFVFSLLLGVLATSVDAGAGINVTFDGRAFIIDGQRTLIVSGSIHYPRASSAEWGPVIRKAKENGINLIETYIFWDIHEPVEGEYYFPSDNSSSDVVAFLRECQRQGLFVNVRFGPYTCAEWNYGGFPAWLREIKDISFRTMNVPFLDRAMRFVGMAARVIQEAGMLASDGGPVIMVQIENEYGNMEHYYGDDGARYVQLNAQFALSLGLDVPWMMCQQGEGVGTAPPASVINTCNGYYCDNWIEGHAAAFPNQPHMWTENWPGWFQNWGQAVPHRPTVDVTFAVARWYAKGGTFMNYYMAFGGTTFGRHVGGPGIITSYDYDVQINEYGLEAEPKFSATRNLHAALMEVAPALLWVDKIPDPIDVTSTCEHHKYDASGEGLGCVSFLSNFGKSNSCVFTIGETSFEVPVWSVSIVKNTCISSASPTLLLNTREDAVGIAANELSSSPLMSFASEEMYVYHETIPPTPDNPSLIFKSEYPLEQLGLTGDRTDYLWYSTTVGAIPHGVDTVNVSYTSGSMAGTHLYAFVNGELVHAAEPYYDSGQDSGVIGASVSFNIPVSTGDNRLDIVVAAMGLQNYGPYLEKRKAGIISNVTVSYSEDVTSELTDFVHVVGLNGEELHLWDTPDSLSWESLSAADCSKPFTWYKVSFDTPQIDLDQPLAIDVVNSESGNSLGKGAMWLNGFHLGRFWDVSARDVPACESCDSSSYVGGYNADSCRTGCGDPSQRLYKIPRGLLHSLESGVSNMLMVLQEVGGTVCPAEVLSLVSVAMESV